MCIRDSFNPVFSTYLKTNPVTLFPFVFLKSQKVHIRVPNTLTELFMTFTDHYDPNLHWVVACFIMFVDLKIITLRVYFYFHKTPKRQWHKYIYFSLFYRAGSSVVKAGDFHRGGRSSYPPEIFENFFPFSFFIKWFWDLIYGLKKF